MEKPHGTILLLISWVKKLTTKKESVWKCFSACLKHPSPETPLSGTHLAGTPLSGTHLAGTPLSGTHLAGTPLSGTHWQYSQRKVLTGKILSGNWQKPSSPQANTSVELTSSSIAHPFHGEVDPHGS